MRTHPDPPPPAEDTSLRGPMRLVSSLRHRDWRYLWSGQMFSQTGEWMDSIAINWLVLIQTNSPLALGTVNLVRGVPNIVFSMAGGVIADRIDRKALMIWTQVGEALCTTALATLASLNLLELWHIYLLIALRGTFSAFNQPARSSLVGDLVPRSDISNAIALHSAIFNSTRMVGPAISGFLIAAYSPSLVLWIHVAANVICLFMIARMNLPPREGNPTQRSAWGSFVEGLAYVRNQPVVLMLLILGILPFLLGQPYQSMLPVYAKDVFNIGAQGLGLLTAAAAGGALVGAFVTAALGDIPRKGLVMIAGMVTFALLIVAFSNSPWPLLAAVILFLIGAANQLYATTNATLIQTTVPSEFRGRVLGIHQLDRGFIPTGSFIAGAIAESAGAPFATTIMASSLAAAGILVFFLVPRMRELR